jgi:hypothetical protein
MFRVFLEAISCFPHSLHAQKRKSSNKCFNQGYTFLPTKCKIKMISAFKETDLKTNLPQKNESYFQIHRLKIRFYS